MSALPYIQLVRHEAEKLVGTDGARIVDKLVSRFSTSESFALLAKQHANNLSDSIVGYLVRKAMWRLVDEHKEFWAA